MGEEDIEPLCRRGPVFLSVGLRNFWPLGVAGLDVSL